MPQRCEDAFASIESAEEYLALLVEAISETKEDVDAEIRECAATASIRTDALRIASYDLALLQHHMHRSKRALNNLCMVRRLLLKERGVPEPESPLVTTVMPSRKVDMPVQPRRVPLSMRRQERRAAREELVQLAAA